MSQQLGSAASRLFALISNSEDPAAKEYWGDFVNDEHSKLDPLLMSIYDFARAVATPVPQVEVTAAKPYVNPQMMRMVHIMLGKDELHYTPEEAKFLDYSTVFDLHRKYYNMYKLPFVEIDDPETKCKMPLITRKSLITFLGYRMVIDPDATLAALNQMLKNFPLLNSDEEPWKYKTIPRSCFPPASDPAMPNAPEVCAKLKETWTKVKAEHMAAARQRGSMAQPQMTPADMMNASANNAIQMQLMAANNTAMMSAASTMGAVAAQNAWSTRNAMAIQSWGNF